MPKGTHTETYSLKDKLLSHRYEHTLDFVKKSIDRPSEILDLGIDNPFTQLLREEGHTVSNTNMGQDLDLDFSQVKETKYDIVTAFQIFEHMVAPFNLLREIKAPRLIASIPLKLWFADAYWNEKDEWDRHYHEFEPRQFDMLLQKSGWKIIDSKKWKAPGGRFGIRPFLRSITDRYYIVYCERDF